jgi:regulator of protease activity HflC (stomatin/prohibitin superfamily)
MNVKFISIFCVVALGMAFWFFPIYGVWTSEQNGKAQLAEAEYSKQVAVQTAKAKQESATYEAQAEITRAQGVAKANQIIGQSLKDNEAYLRYLWIHTMEDTKNQVIYVPTETSLPILEASRKANLRSVSSENR